MDHVHHGVGGLGQFFFVFEQGLFLVQQRLELLLLIGPQLGGRSQGCTFSRLIFGQATALVLVAAAAGECIVHALQRAGAPKLMSAELVATLCDHAQGNLRALMNMAGELLSIAAQRELPQLDEKLFLEVFAVPQSGQVKAAGRRR